MNELAPTQDSPMAVIQTAIQSGASPETLEQLMNLQERYDAKNAEKAFNAAMVKAQSEMPTVFKGRNNPGTRSNYASYDDIMRVVRPVLDAHQLAISFKQTDTPETITVVCVIMHSDGHSSETPFTLPKDDVIKSSTGKSVTNRAQAQGSANSYAKRYCIANALNIVLGDQDDDARALDQPIKTVTQEQAAELQDMVMESGVDEAKFLNAYNAENYEAIAIPFYAKAKSILEKRIANNESREGKE